eukprot:SAG25_NODE_4379_length_828_cov_0.684499_1_plen_116_part_10
MCDGISAHSRWGLSQGVNWPVRVGWVRPDMQALAPFSARQSNLLRIECWRRALVRRQPPISPAGGRLFTRRCGGTSGISVLPLGGSLASSPSPIFAEAGGGGKGDHAPEGGGGWFC